jgi:hypothetical protein
VDGTAVGAAAGAWVGAGGGFCPAGAVGAAQAASAATAIIKTTTATVIFKRARFILLFLPLIGAQT